MLTVAKRIISIRLGCRIRSITIEYRCNLISIEWGLLPKSCHITVSLKEKWGKNEVSFRIQGEEPNLHFGFVGISGVLHHNAYLSIFLT